MANYSNTVKDLYGTYLGRAPDQAGLDYWVKELEKGKTVKDLTSGIQSGSEYKGRKNVVDTYMSANDGKAPAESYIDARISPGGGVFENPGKTFMAPVFAADNTWASPLLTSGDNSWENELEDVYRDLKIGGASTTGSPHYSTAALDNTGAVKIGTTHDAAGNPWVPKTTDTLQVDANSIPGTDPSVVETLQTGTAPGTDPQYLTSQGLTDWWDKLDKPWLNQTDDTAAAANTGSNDDFMKMMMFMAMMRPQGGGWGGGQYGYGGLNPGGVQSAYNPMANLQGYMDAFKTLPGLSSSTISTGTN